MWGRSDRTTCGARSSSTGTHQLSSSSTSASKTRQLGGASLERRLSIEATFPKGSPYVLDDEWGGAWGRPSPGTQGEARERRQRGTALAAQDRFSVLPETQRQASHTGLVLAGRRYLCW